MSTCGADTAANELTESLTEGKTFTLPEVDFEDPEFQFPYDPDSPLYSSVDEITVSDLTTKVVNGDGVFDALMTTFGAHLRNEYEKGRIAAADYTKAYTALAESAMSQAVAFLLGKDASFWQAQQAQLQALTARIQMETAKVQLAALQSEALTQEANYALTKMKVATEEIGYCSAKYTLENMLPQQLLNLEQQEELLKEQTEVQRAQTMELRSDGGLVLGVLGKQKDLYAQQVTSYQRDSEIKAAKPFVDAWITMKTMDEGLIPPPCFTNESVDEVMNTIKANNNLD